jgi:hypothetical protein
MKSQQFKDLQDKWYKKLAKSGFEDIEQDEDHLINWSSSRALRGKVNGSAYADVIVSHQAVEEYYRLAGHFLHDYKFKDEYEKKVWILHADGNSHRDVAEALRTKSRKANKDSVNTIVKRLSKEMLTMYRQKDAKE